MSPVTHCQRYVLYNDGTSEDVHALVIGGHDGGLLSLFVVPTSGDSYVVNGVPRRDKAEYDTAGGGRTWHL